MKRILSGLLLLCLLGTAALGEGVDIAFSAEKSDVMPSSALEALGVLLEGLTLTVLPDADGAGLMLRRGGEELLSAEVTAAGGFLRSGDTAAPLAGEAQWSGASMAEINAKLGAVLSDWEKTEEKEITLENVGTSRRQLVYALDGEAWEGVWPQVMEVLTDAAPQLEVLRPLRIQGKGTLKRYFDKNGTEIGGYFYAAQAAPEAQDVREVRLEWGYAPGSGVYAAFRCPNAAGTRNIRLSLRVRITEKNGAQTYKMTADVRVINGADSDVVTLEGRHEGEGGTGRLKAQLNRRREGKTVKHALTLSWQQMLVEYAYDRGGKTLLAGTAAVTAAQGAIIPCALAEDSAEDVALALAKKLLGILSEEAPESMQALLHYLSTDGYLTGETTQLHLPQEPQLTVTEGE